MTLERGPLEPGVDAHAPPAAIGDYRVGARLGAGGYGAVYRASHAVIEREAAIKVLHADRCHDPDAVARFVDEARAVNLVRHPGIVEIFGFGELADGRHYFVMELLRGETLREVLDRRGHLPLAEAVPVLRGIAEALDAAHAAGIAHRDVKPENVMVLDGGGVKLFDFGLAKLAAPTAQTQSGAVLGTPRYMSPEQCRGRASDERADLYAFGAVAYHVLAGAPPFGGDALALALHHVNDVPLPASTRNRELGPAVDVVLAALLDKTPSRRPRPLVAAVDALTAPPPRRRRWWWFAVPAAVTVAVAAAAASVTSGTRGPAVAGTPIAIEQDHVFAPFVSHDGDVSFMNEDGLWVYRDGVARLLDATASYRSQFDDGAWFVTRESASEGPSAWLERGDQPARRIAAGAWGEASTAGSRFVVARDGAVTLGTLETADVFPLPIRDDDSAGGWSPDGMKGIVGTPWLHGPSGREDTAIMGTGGMRGVELQMLDGSPGIRSVCFVSSDQALYCGRGGTLRIRDLVNGRDRDVIPLPEGTRSCDLAVTPDTKRAFVSAGIEHDVAGWLEPGSGAVDDAPARACPDEVGAVVVGGRRLHALHPAPASPVLALATDGCLPVKMWMLPPGVASAPSCAGERCVVAIENRDHIDVYELGDGASPVPLVSAAAAWAVARLPLVALAPDGVQLAVGARGAGQVLVYGASSAPRTIAIPPSHADRWMPPTAVESLAWLGDELYASTVGVDGVRFGVHRLARDGSRQQVWRSDTVRAKLDGSTDAGRLGLVRMEVRSQPMWVDL